MLSSNHPCDRCGTRHVNTKPYRKETFTGPENSFEIKTTLIYLCEDCAKTTAKDWGPGFKRLNEAQELLDGAGDLDDEDKE
jgi:hypothetical protein